MKTVTAEILGQGPKHLVRLTLSIETDGGKRTASVTATAGHPFWVPKLGAWVDATNLTVGDQLDAPTGAVVRITGVRHWTQAATVHNLTVADIHTYCVLAGQTPVLVHNSTPCTPGIGPQRPAGVGDNWAARAADNGKGSVWQNPGSTGNADMLRVMNPTSMYPNGYVRFTNKHGQPIGLDGKPGSKAATHILMNFDGTYPLPMGW